MPYGSYGQGTYGGGSYSQLAGKWLPVVLTSRALGTGMQVVAETTQMTSRVVSAGWSLTAVDVPLTLKIDETL